MLINHRILSGILFVLTQKIQEPWRYHLFGVVTDSGLLPLVLPYKASLDRPMFSEMSFKCRSSTSLSSHTLVQSSNDSMTTLLPSRPEKAAGLGMYASRYSARSFLSPRPSLSSIRSQAPMGLLPPPSQLPPLPAYFPDRYRNGSTMHKAVNPPKRGLREKTVRIVPPSPPLSAANLAAFNKSQESLSSVYSRDISGEKDSPRPHQRQRTLEASRRYSSSSTATLKRSLLGAMRLARDPAIVVGPRVSSEGSSSEIDDALTLQARLPSVKPVNGFENVGKRACSSQKMASDYQKLHLVDEDKTTDGLAFNPLNVHKTRDSANLFQSHLVKAVA